MSSPGGSAAHLDIGGVFEATTEIYKKVFGTVWIVALILLIPAAIINGLLGDGGLGGLIGGIIQLVATAWLLGSVVRIVQDVEQDGQVDWSVGEILSSIAPRLFWIILLQFVVGILVGIGLILFIIPGVILALMWAVSLPALVVEEKGVFDSMSRSSKLTKENRMRILGIILLVLLVYIAIALVVGLLTAAAPVIGIIALIVIGVVAYPYVAIISAVLYFRLVELKEGAVVAVEESVVVEETTPEPPPAV
jgi:hypothetical protein